MHFKNLDRTNKKILRNRLLTLIFDIKKYDSPRDLSKDIYKTGKIFTFKNNSTKSELTIKSEEAIYKDIQNQLNSSNNNEFIHNLTASYLLAYCEIFRCHPNYILGKTEIISNDPNIIISSNYTGLTENAIDKIRSLTYAFDKYKDDINSNLISNIFISNKFELLIDSIESYNVYRQNEDNKYKKLEDKYKSISKDKIDFAEKVIDIISRPEDCRSPDEITILNTAPKDTQEIINTINEYETASYEYDQKKIFDKEYNKFRIQKIFGEIIDEILGD